MSKQRRFLFFLPKIVFSLSLSLCLISVSLAFSIIRLSLAKPPKTKPLWNAVNYQWPPWATNLRVCVSFFAQLLLLLFFLVKTSEYQHCRISDFVISSVAVTITITHELLALGWCYRFWGFLWRTDALDFGISGHGVRAF